LSPIADMQLLPSRQTSAVGPSCSAMLRMSKGGHFNVAIA